MGIEFNHVLLVVIPLAFLVVISLFFFSSRRRHTRLTCDWSSDVCSSDLLLIGAEGALDVRSRWRFAVHAAAGSLSGQVTDAEQRDVGELGVRASFAPAPWVALVGGATSRTYTSAIARQRWTIVDLGAEARLDFATTPVRGVLRAGVRPVVAVRGLPGLEVGLAAWAGVVSRAWCAPCGLGA